MSKLGSQERMVAFNSLSIDSIRYHSRFSEASRAIYSAFISSLLNETYRFSLAEWIIKCGVIYGGQLSCPCSNERTFDSSGDGSSVSEQMGSLCPSILDSGLVILKSLSASSIFTRDR